MLVRPRRKWKQYTSLSSRRKWKKNLQMLPCTYIYVYSCKLPGYRYMYLYLWLFACTKPHILLSSIDWYSMQKAWAGRFRSAGATLEYTAYIERSILSAGSCKQPTNKHIFPGQNISYHFKWTPMDFLRNCQERLLPCALISTPKWAKHCASMKWCSLLQRRLKVIRRSASCLPV